MYVHLFTSHTALGYVTILASMLVIKYNVYIGSLLSKLLDMHICEYDMVVASYTSFI